MGRHAPAIPEDRMAALRLDPDEIDHFELFEHGDLHGLAGRGMQPQHRVVSFLADIQTVGGKRAEIVQAQAKAKAAIFELFDEAFGFERADEPRGGAFRQPQATRYLADPQNRVIFIERLQYAQRVLHRGEWPRAGRGRRLCDHGQELWPPPKSNLFEGASMTERDRVARRRLDSIRHARNVGRLRLVARMGRTDRGGLPTKSSSRRRRCAANR